jgi:flagella basal body P-ring formation protein FlgA
MSAVQFEMEFNLMQSAAKQKSNAILILFVVVLSAASCFSPTRARGQTDLDPADAPVTLSSSPVLDAGTTHFVPNPRHIACQGTLEVQKVARIPGNKIRLRQVVRWADVDAPSFAPIADLVIDNFDGLGNRKLSLDEIRSTLTAAGVNLGDVRFCGSSCCLVSRTGEPEPAPPTDTRAVVAQWIDQNNKTAASAVPPATTQPAQAVVNSADTLDADGNPFHTLRDRVLIDLSQRLNLPEDELQVTFDPKDRTLLNLAEPIFRFQLDPHRVHDLGQVSWDVTIMSGDNQQKLMLIANARCWQREIVMARAVSYREVLRDRDITERRVLVDHIPDDQMLTRTQIIGQQAARDLKPGVVLTSRLIDPVPLAHIGDLITVTLNQGGVEIRSVAIAQESGSFGQTIKLKSDRTQDVFQATLTGPQAASVGAVAAPDPDAKLASDRD